MPLFKTPFSRAYWREASHELGKLRVNSFCALMIAAAVILSAFVRIPLAPNLDLTTSFVARALCAWVAGPVAGLLFGFTEDILGYLLHPRGPYFPGYTLNTMLAVFLYGLFFYRQKVTVLRIFLVKLLVNYPINVGLGCLWNWYLTGKAYLVILGTSAVKNTIYLPFQVLMILVLFRALLPALQRTGLLSPQQGNRIPWF